MLDEMPEWLTSAFGLVGVAFYLGAYAALQMGFVRGTGYTYAVLNIVAAGSVAISLIHAFNLSSLLIQISWITISLAGIARVFLMTHMVRFTDEEAIFYRSKLPALPKHLARQFLNLATWRDMLPGELLTEHGKPVDALTYISSGTAEAKVAGQVVGTVGPDTMVGEFAVLSDDLATATVRITQTVRACIVPSVPLKSFLPQNTEVELALRKQFILEARHKMIARNTDQLTDAMSDARALGG